MMGSTVEFRKAFVGRLKQSCDESKHIPLPGHGRQQFIVDRLKVTPEAVSKWFNGVSMPRPDKMEALAELLECDQAWLAYGIQPEMDRDERRQHKRESDGAVQLILGMMLLAGAHCGQPRLTDPRNEYVDFYATVRGTVYPVHVSMAREASSGMFCCEFFNEEHRLHSAPMNDTLINFETRTGLVPADAARLLGIGYSTYAAYRAGTRVLPRYHYCHVRAILDRSEAHLKRYTKEHAHEHG